MIRWLCLVVVAGCWGGSSGDNVHGWDVRGNYALSYDPYLSLELSVGRRVSRAASNGHDVAQLGDFRFDVAAFCARRDVRCPASEPRVSIDQLDVDANQPQHAIDLVGLAGVHSRGIVDHAQLDTFVIGLGDDAAVDPHCIELAGSVVSGRFTHRGEVVSSEPGWRDGDGGSCTPAPPDGGSDGCNLQLTSGGVIWPADAPVDGIADGQWTAAWPASCVFPRTPPGATLTFSIGFAATRTGDYAPPAPPDLSLPDLALPFDLAPID